MASKYTDKELLILEQFQKGPYYTLVTNLTEEEHLKFINKLINDNNIRCLIFLTCIYTSYNNQYLIDYFISNRSADELADFLDACNDFWEELDQKSIIDKIIAKKDKKYVKELLDTKWLFFLTDKEQRHRLEEFIK